MTRPLRAGILIACLTALIGAPSVVAAAEPNDPSPGIIVQKKAVAEPPTAPQVVPVANQATVSPAAKPEPTPAAPVTLLAEAPSSPREMLGTAPDNHVANPRPDGVVAGNRSAAPAAPADGPAGSPGAHSPVTASSPSSARRHSPAPGITGPLFSGTGSSWTTLALLVFGVATLTVTGIGWLVLGRRRPDDDELLLATGDSGPMDSAATERPPKDQALRRAARRRRLDLSDDPIVAAMGIKPRRGSTPRPGAEPVNQGPEERPTRAPRVRRP